jgi:hypothetical protein
MNKLKKALDDKLCEVNKIKEDFNNKLQEVDKLKEKLNGKTREMIKLKGLLRDRTNEVNKFKKNNVDNFKKMNDLMNFILNVFNLTDIFNIEVNIYGELLKSFLLKKDINNKTLNFLIVSDFIHIQKILSNLNLNFDISLDHKINKKIIKIINSEEYCYDIWNFKLKIEENNYDIIFHNGCSINRVVFDIDTICLSKNGFIMKQIHSDEDQKMKNNYIGFNYLKLFNNLLHNKVEFIKKFSNLNDYEQNKYIFEMVHSYKDNESEIINGFVTDKKNNCSICYNNNEENNTTIFKLECSHFFCADCIFKHFQNHYNRGCPVCRQDMNMVHL